jgi:hypothetical protein
LGGAGGCDGTFAEEALMRILIEALAEVDVQSIASFYDEAELGLGRDFLTQWERDLRRLETTAGVHRKRWGYHFCMMRRFPVANYYLVRDEAIHIVAVLDCRRNPKIIQGRLGKN